MQSRSPRGRLVTKALDEELILGFNKGGGGEGARENNNKLGPYFNPTYTRTGWIGQPPVLDRHEVVTIDGDVDTLRQATP